MSCHASRGSAVVLVRSSDSILNERRLMPRTRTSDATATRDTAERGMIATAVQRTMTTAWLASAEMSRMRLDAFCARRARTSELFWRNEEYEAASRQWRKRLATGRYRQAGRVTSRSRLLLLTRTRRVCVAQQLFLWWHRIGVRAQRFKYAQCVAVNMERGHSLLLQHHHPFRCIQNGASSLEQHLPRRRLRSCAAAIDPSAVASIPSTASNWFDDAQSDIRRTTVETRDSERHWTRRPDLLHHR